MSGMLDERSFDFLVSIIRLFVFAFCFFVCYNLVGNFIGF